MSAPIPQWRERFQEGRYRGAAFLIESHDASGGRRGPTHEFPMRDEPFAEDLGRKAREFSIECYVLGANYMEARDALIDALERSGPGLLVHPYLGTQSVVAREYKLHESSAEGGRANFSITFVEAGQEAEADTAPDTAAELLSASDAASTAAQSDFAAIFDVARQAGYVADAAIAAVSDALAEVEQAVGAVTGPIAAAIRAPVNMAAQIVGAIARLQALVRQPLDALRLYGALFNAGRSSLAVPLTTSERIQQAHNQEAIGALVRRAAIAAAAASLAQSTFENGTDALAARDTLLDALDSELLDVSVVDGRPVPDAIYTALVALSTAISRDLATRAAKLPRIVHYTPRVTRPALVLAYDIHGDCMRDAEIVARNRIRRPGFVPGGIALEVLSDA